VKKIVSLALFGEGEKYSQYLPAFIRAHLNLFPQRDGWTLRVHVDDKQSESFRGRQLMRLADDGLIEIVYMGPAILTKAMLWRMAPVFDKDVEYVFCRDVDCVPMPRDRAVMEQFIASGATVHTVHDNVLHVGMMGGLCGFHAPTFRQATGFFTLEQVYAFAETAKWEEHGTDQTVLNRICLRPGGPVLLEHRFNGWHGGPGKQKKRGPQAYPNPAYSAPIPDVGVSPFDASRAAAADLLANHLGAAGFDHDAAVRFYDKNGDPEIADRVYRAETAGGSLMLFAQNKYSQNGEDGVLEEILIRLGISKGCFIEFGAGNGRTLSNTLKLAEEGWKGLWFEQNQFSAAAAGALAGQFEGRVKVVCTTVESEGPNSLNQQVHRHAEFDRLDLLAIDIDSHDLEVWESFWGNPPVVMVEINSTVPIGVHQRHGNGKESASFTSMLEVATKKGYRLACHTGNLIFVRADLFDKLKLPAQEHSPENLFNDIWTKMAPKRFAYVPVTSAQPAQERL
jgi:hypothetical protein